MRTLTGDRPPRAALVGVIVGFGGLVLLVRPSGGAPLWSLLLVVCSSVMWATGSFLSSRLPLPRDSFAATSYEMLAGGLILLPIGLATTHPHFSQFSGRSIFGFFYLVTFGSVIGYTAYVWLLDNAPIGKVATYAYVNPVVAIALGAIVLHESLTWSIGSARCSCSRASRSSSGARAEGPERGAGRQTGSALVHVARQQRVHRPVLPPAEARVPVRAPQDALEREARLLGGAARADVLDVRAQLEPRDALALERPRARRARARA